MNAFITMRYHFMHFQDISTSMTKIPNLQKVMYFSGDSAAQQRTEFINIYHEQDFNLCWMACLHKPWEWNRKDSEKAGCTGKQRTYKFKYLTNYLITAAATYKTLHSLTSKMNKHLIIRRNLQINFIWHLQYQEIKLINLSSH